MPQILIVEDEAAIADTLVYALQAEGFATRWVTLAGEALALLEDQAFDWIVAAAKVTDQPGTFKDIMNFGAESASDEAG